MFRLRLKRRSFSAGCALLAALLALPRDARAGPDGRIAGRVAGPDGSPAAEAMVEVLPLSGGQPRKASCDAQGRFAVEGLTAGRYRVRAASRGFASDAMVVDLPGRAGGSDFVLTLLATRQEEVLVRSVALDAPPPSGTSIAEETIRRLPAGRNFADLVLAAPGAGLGVAMAHGRALPISIYGASPMENQFIVDGAPATEGFLGTQGKIIPPEYLERLDVLSGGYSAEYGGALGGVIRLATRSGGPEFHGEASSYYDSDDTRARQRSTQTSAGIQTRFVDTSRTEIGATLGGPVVRDRVWFFGGYDRANEPGHITNTFLNSNRFPLDRLEEFWIARLTAEPIAGTAVSLTWLGDPKTTTGAATADPTQDIASLIPTTDPASWESRNDQGGRDLTLRVTQRLGRAGLLGVQGSEHSDRSSLKPSGAGDTPNLLDFTCLSGSPARPCTPPSAPRSQTRTRNNTGGVFADHTATWRTLRVDDTAVWNAHEPKAGIEYGRYTFTRLSRTPGGQTVSEFNDRGTIYFRHQFFGKPDDVQSPIDHGPPRDSNRLAFFLQDRWRLTDGLTVDVGVRRDSEKLADSTGTPVLSTAVWQPRLGVSWDPWRAGRTLVFASAGRFAYAVPAAITTRFGSSVFSTTWNFDPVMTRQDPAVAGHPATVIEPGVVNAVVDPNVRGMYQDEAQVGVSHRLTSTTSVDVRGVYRRLGRAIDDRCDLDPSVYEDNCAIINPGSGEAFAGGRFFYCTNLDGAADNCSGPAPQALFGAPASPAATRTYRGIETTIRTELGRRLWLQASYTYSSLEGNYEGVVDPKQIFASPVGSPAFDYYEQYTNSTGRLFLDRPHRIRLDAQGRGPLGIEAGFQFFFLSGPPRDQLGVASRALAFTPTYLVSRGSAGRAPSIWDANLVLGIPLRIGPAEVVARAYVFNLFNRQNATMLDDRYVIANPLGDIPPTILWPNYGGSVRRADPRLLRVSLKGRF